MARGFGSVLGSSANNSYVAGPAINVGTKVSFSMWMYINGAGGSNFGSIFNLSSAGGGLGLEFCLFMGGSISSPFGFARMFSGQFGGFNWAVPPARTWANVTVTYDAGSVSNFPVAYINGVRQVVTAYQSPIGTATAVNFICTLSGANGFNAPANTWDGMLAHAAFWNNYILSDAEALALGTGENPSHVAPEFLTMYLPLDGVNIPEPDLVNGTTLKVVGTNLGISDPPVKSLWAQNPMPDASISGIIQRALAAMASIKVRAKAGFSGTVALTSKVTAETSSRGVASVTTRLTAAIKTAVRIAPSISFRAPLAAVIKAMVRLRSMLGIQVPATVNPARLLSVFAKRILTPETTRVFPVRARRLVMYAGQDFSYIEPGETDNFSIDFEPRLASGETLVSSDWACSLVPNSNGNDTTPSDRLNGTSTINGSISSQSITNCLVGNYYLVEATVITSAGRTLKGYSRFQCASAQ